VSATQLNLYDQIAATGAGITPAAGDVPFIDAGGVIIQKPGVGALRTKYAMYAPSGTQRYGTTDIDVLSDGTAYLGSSLTVKAATLQQAGNALIIKAGVQGRSVAYRTSGYNNLYWKLWLGSTALLTINDHNSVPTSQDFWWDISAAIEVASVSGSTSTLNARLGPIITLQAGPATGAGVVQTMGQTASFANTGDVTLALTLQGPHNSTSYLYWYNLEAFVWQIP